MSHVEPDTPGRVYSVVARDLRQALAREEELKRRTAALAERVKEQACLRAVVGTLIGQQEPLEERLQQVADQLPSGFQSPETTLARIQVGDRSYRSGAEEGFATAVERPIRIEDSTVGALRVETVASSELRSRASCDPFLEEERLLVETVALLVSEALSRAAAEEALLERSRAMKKELEERARLEVELQRAHRMEAVGQLAAGIAHEINTPIQFIGDSLAFIQEALACYSQVYPHHRRLIDGSLQVEELATHAAEAIRLREELDLEFQLRELPGALQRAREGVERVRRIVVAMKGFAHPGQAKMTRVDVPHAVEETLTVAWNELKYVADVERDFEPVPQLLCHPGDLSQVLLNLLVNAAQAIGEVVGSSGDKGTIQVSVRRADEDRLLISVADTGPGIPEGIREQIFDQFFTTKQPGRGTGQGLSIVRGLVVDRMGGTIEFETETGRGTVFHVRVPVDGPVAPPEQEP